VYSKKLWVFSTCVWVTYKQNQPLVYIFFINFLNPMVGFVHI